MCNSSQLFPRQLIGILSGDHRFRSFSGNALFFNTIISRAQKMGFTVYVFTPKGIKTKTIEGYTLVRGYWEKTTFPYPELVYNRLPSRKVERRLEPFFQKLRSLSIPYFNSYFLDKWKTYQLLTMNAPLQPFLPETMLLTNEQEAIYFLESFSFIYGKPLQGKGGNGIFTLSVLKDQNVRLKTQTTTKILSKNQLFFFFTYLLHLNSVYLLQQGIHLNRHLSKTYDFRILMQKPETNWAVTGVGVRSAKKNGITTHVPQGGDVLFLSDIKPSIDWTLITKLGKETARMLESVSTFREFVIDVGRDIANKYWIFELNVKPMIFDEKEIEAKRVHTLIHTFHHLLKREKNHC